MLNLCGAVLGFVLVATITGCSTSQNADTMEAEVRFIRSLMERYDAAVYGQRMSEV